MTNKFYQSLGTLLNCINMYMYTMYVGATPTQPFLLVAKVRNTDKLSKPQTPEIFQECIYSVMTNGIKNNDS